MVAAILNRVEIGECLITLSAAIREPALHNFIIVAERERKRDLHKLKDKFQKARQTDKRNNRAEECGSLARIEISREIGDASVPLSVSRHCVSA